jgi:glycosyltransferase involved in cell wall biosynthesis
VVLEAMASGAPVVGYEATSMPELVDHSITGYLCDTGEIDQLVQGVEHVTEHRDRMSRAARDYTLTYHQFNRIAERYSRVYAKLE